ncbi:hypothetical protein GCM10010517_15190 [Streptosporangium fragile]|uniref:Uncharacterized protein n=1 Tax=Streptosporangium fragile TaxID=46186 RepID=A0ABN3VSE9_9ACTN
MPLPWASEGGALAVARHETALDVVDPRAPQPPDVAAVHTAQRGVVLVGQVPADLGKVPVGAVCGGGRCLPGSHERDGGDGARE